MKAFFKKYFNAIDIVFIMILLLVLSVITYSYSAIFHNLYCEYGPWTNQPLPKIKPITMPKKGLVTIWFDDAYTSQASKDLLNIMVKNEFVAAVSVPTGFICQLGRLTWKELQSLQNKGWEITSHSVSHYCNPSQYRSEAIIHYEVVHSKKNLESRGLRADNFVIPCGFDSNILPKVFTVVKKNYNSYRVAKEEINAIPVLDPYHLNSFSVSYKTTEAEVQHFIDLAKNQNAWFIIVFHQISDVELPYHTSFTQFKRFLALIKESGMPVVLPEQVLRLNRGYH